MMAQPCESRRAVIVASCHSSQTDHPRLHSLGPRNQSAVTIPNCSPGINNDPATNTRFRAASTLPPDSNPRQARYITSGVRMDATGVNDQAEKLAMGNHSSDVLAI